MDRFDSAKFIERARGGFTKPPMNPKKKSGNPGPPPWAKGAGPGLSSTPKTDKPRTVLSGEGKYAPPVPSMASRLKSKAKQASSTGRGIGYAPPPKRGISFGSTGKVGNTRTFGLRGTF